MKKQTTDTIMMIRPRNFGYNHETAIDNAFQCNDGNQSEEKIKALAVKEFDDFVIKLRDAGIKVVIVEDTEQPVKSDAIFPNNWISFHEEGWIITYPMFSKNRRMERREDIVDLMTEQFGYNKRYSFEHYEDENIFLEGTGSLVLDRVDKIAYASLSERTDITILDKWAILTGYRTCIFNGVDKNGDPIYHTNVLMAMGKEYVVICMECIQDPQQKSELSENFDKTGKKIINISFDQMEAFAGNMLQLSGSGKEYIVMSQQAYKSLTDKQIAQLRESTEILFSDISTIEKYGGGSVRCMMAEIFYPAAI